MGLDIVSLFNYTLFWIIILGLCLGSFYNVVILRSLANESIIYPPSKCPKCGNKLLWWHNIPVLSYILLRGKCYFCKEKISIQYPIVEIFTAAAFGVIFAKYGFELKTIFALFIISCFIIMTSTDLKEKLVDCNIAIAAAVAGCLYHLISGGFYGLLVSLSALLVGVLIIEGIARAGIYIAGTRAMGEADSYVAGALGAIYGTNILWVLIYALGASMVFILPLYIYNRYKAGDKLTCISAVLFALAIVIFKAASQNYLTLAFLLVTGIFLTVNVLKGIRQEESKTYLPFVPALMAGAVIFSLLN